MCTSRAAAVELAKNAPGDDAHTRGARVVYAQDFGAPPDPNPPVPPPPPVRKPGTHRYIAFIRSHDEDANSFPTPESMARMDEYCAPLVESNTMIGGEGLKPSAKGTRVRRASGATVHPRRTVHRIEGARWWLHDRAGAHARRSGRYD